MSSFTSLFFGGANEVSDTLDSSSTRHKERLQAMLSDFTNAISVHLSKVKKFEARMEDHQTVLKDCINALSIQQGKVKEYKTDMDSYGTALKSCETTLLQLGDGTDDDIEEILPTVKEIEALIKQLRGNMMDHEAKMKDHDDHLEVVKASISSAIEKGLGSD